MEKWWNETFFNRRNWILENYQNLNLTAAEGLILLTVDYMNEFGKEFTIQTLADKLHMDVKTVDQTISLLATKGYLKIASDGKRIRFLIDGVFDSPKVSFTKLSSIFEIFEEEMGRTLNQNELREINEWLEKYKEEDILYSLRQASIYGKKNFGYIRTILESKGKSST